MNQHLPLFHSNPGDQCRLSVFPQLRPVEADAIEHNASSPAADYRNVIVPLDGSASAEHALPHALAVARRSGGTVRLAHVHSTADSLNDPWAQFYGLDVCNHQYEWMQNYLQDLVRRIRRVDTVKLIPDLSKSNDVIDSLCRAAEKCDLVVMATRGRGFWKRLWRSSISNALVRRLDCPLLVVRGRDLPADLGRCGQYRPHLAPVVNDVVLDVSSPHSRYG